MVGFGPLTLWSAAQGVPGRRRLCILLALAALAAAGLALPAARYRAGRAPAHRHDVQHLVRRRAGRLPAGCALDSGSGGGCRRRPGARGEPAQARRGGRPPLRRRQPPPDLALPAVRGRAARPAARLRGARPRSRRRRRQPAPDLLSLRPRGGGRGQACAAGPRARALSAAARDPSLHPLARPARPGAASRPSSPATSTLPRTSTGPRRWPWRARSGCPIRSPGPCRLRSPGQASATRTARRTRIPSRLPGTPGRPARRRREYGAGRRSTGSTG